MPVGGSLWAPRDVPHRYANTGTTGGKLIFVCQPGECMSKNNARCFSCVLRSRATALSSLIVTICPAADAAQRGYKCPPCLVREYPTAMDFDPVTCLEINPADSRLRSVRVRIRCETKRLPSKCFGDRSHGSGTELQNGSPPRFCKGGHRVGTPPSKAWPAKKG